MPWSLRPGSLRAGVQGCLLGLGQKQISVWDQRGFGQLSLRSLGPAGLRSFPPGPGTPEEYNLSHSYSFTGGEVGKKGRPCEGVLDRQGTG